LRAARAVCDARFAACGQSRQAVALWKMMNLQDSARIAAAGICASAAVRELIGGEIDSQRRQVTRQWFY
jgi:hypothetical protein